MFQSGRHSFCTVMPYTQWISYIILIIGLVVLMIGSVRGTKDTTNEKNNRPNIIFILVDDVGYNDVGYNNPMVFTPTLDQLATSGRIFTQSYFQSICTPSRGALMTGIYPFRIGMQDVVYQATLPDCAPTNLKLLPEALKESGYKTHLIGKWHMGFCKLECTPTYRGFDTFYGGYLGGGDHFNHTDMEGYGFYDWRDGIDVDRSAIGHYSTHLLTERAIRIIESHNSTDKPFFLMLSFQAPHVPNQVPAKYLELYPEVENEMVRTYYAMITAVDVGISKLYDQLVRLNMADNTLMVFSSDNGGDAWTATSDNTPFRGAKTSLWEGGTRVVTFVHGTMLSNTGQKHDGLIHAVDWYPTLLKIAGGSAGGLYLDGHDQSDMVLDGKPSQRSEIIYNINTEPVSIAGHCAIRNGDYKLIWGYVGTIDGWGRENTFFTSDPNKTCLIRVDDQTVASTHPYGDLLSPENIPCLLNATARAAIDPDDFHSGDTYLFNIKVDPEERKNLADIPGYQEKVRDMKKRIVEMIRYIHKPRQLPRRPQQAVDKDGNWSPGWCDDVDLTVHIRSSSSVLRYNTLFVIPLVLTVAKVETSA